MSGESEGEKTHDPSPKKREDARKQGDIARSNDVTIAAVYLAILLLAVWPAGGMLRHSAAQLQAFLGHPEILTVPLTQQVSAATIFAQVLRALTPLLPLLILPALAALVAVYAQRAVVLVPSRLKPKLNRISPSRGFSSRFGRSGLFEFTKNLAKLATITLVAWKVVQRETVSIIGLAAASPAMVFLNLGRIATSLLAWISLAAVVIAAIDYSWQRFEHGRRLRMTLQELRDETRESEGDPHVKGQRRRRAIEIATSRMLLDVPAADVVIVNPTHYAVALKWSRAKASAPVCVAKGTDTVAASIRSTAALAGVPVHSDPPTARSIHSLVDVGQEIRPEHFRAVAAAIQFSQKMRRAARERNGG